VPSPTLSRMLFVLGLAGIAAAALLKREWTAETNIAVFGVVSLAALGFFGAITGLYGILREPAPATALQAARQRVNGTAAWRAVLPPVIAGVVMVGFFWLTDRWDNLANPVQSQVALFAGVLGALIGMLADRITRWELIIIPAALIVGLIAWGDRLPLESESTTKGQMIALLVIAVLIIGIAINLPQILRGKRVAAAA
jgi:hypothetical protein